MQKYLLFRTMNYSGLLSLADLVSVLVHLRKWIVEGDEQEKASQEVYQHPPPGRHLDVGENVYEPYDKPEQIPFHGPILRQRVVHRLQLQNSMMPAKDVLQKHSPDEKAKDRFVETSAV
jgi:hypothetical protein